MTRYRPTVLLLSIVMSMSSTCIAAKRPECVSALPADANPEAIRIACEIPKAHQYDVSMAQIFGTAMRRHDMAAWLTTDELLKIRAFDNMPGNGSGWITNEEDDGVQVWYFNRVGERYGIAAQAKLRYEPWGVIDARRMFDAPEKEREPDAKMIEMLHAKEFAMRQNLLNCNPNRPFNSVVLPMSEDGMEYILVFLLSAWDDNVVPLGGFHMLRVRPDGEAMLSTYSQTQGCRNLAPSEFDKAAELAVAHDSAAAPTPIHVFLSLQYRKPLYVKTTQNGLIWKIDGPKITVASPDDPALSRLGERFATADQTADKPADKPAESNDDKIRKTDANP